MLTITNKSCIRFIVNRDLARTDYGIDRRCLDAERVEVDFLEKSLRFVTAEGGCCGLYNLTPSRRKSLEDWINSAQL